MATIIVHQIMYLLFAVIPNYHDTYTIRMTVQMEEMDVNQDV